MNQQPDSPTELLTSPEAYEKAGKNPPAATQASQIPAIQQRDSQIIESKRKSLEFLERELSLRGQISAEGPFDVNIKYKLSEIFRFFANRFQLRRRFSNIHFSPAINLCSTLDEFLLPILEGHHLSPERKAIELKRLKELYAQWAREGRGYGGVYLPGQGIFVNGWLYGYNRPISPQGIWSDPALLPNLLHTTLHEALGHALLAEYSALGCEKTSLRLQALDYAVDFELRTVDDANRAVLNWKSNIVNLASRYLEEGWATWAAGVFMPMFGRKPLYTDTLKSVWQTVESYALPPADKTSIRDSLSKLFLEPTTDHDELSQAMRRLQKVGLDPNSGPGHGSEFPYMVGTLLVEQLELHLGIELVPYAILIAANVTYDLDKISCTDLNSLVMNSAPFNPDCRLVLLSKLELPKPVTLSALAEAARGQLNLAVPAELMT